MNKIPLKSLMLRDFQGGTVSLDADGKDINVFGSNSSGKTRLMSAFMWLLTGKDSLGRADFQIKNLDREGNQEHGLEHTVEAVFEIGGNALSLRKTYHEVWTKKRGSAKAELTGNTTDHFIDGVPVKENEYKARTSEIFGDEQRFRLLTNPAVFATMPWQKQRSLLLEVCGDIPDDQIIAENEELFPLRAALAKYTVSKTPLEDLKKVTMGRRIEINKQIDQIPVRIDETRRGLPDVTGLDRLVLAEEVKTLEESLNSAKLRLAGVDTGGKIAPLTKELNTVAAEISRLENEHRMKQEVVISGLNRRIRELMDADETAARKAKSTKAEIAEKNTRIQSIDNSLAVLREKWNGIDGEEFQDGTELICYACKQPLPEDRVEAAREKARAAFNTSKAERLADVQTKGKHQSAEKERLEKEMAELVSGYAAPLGNKEEIDRLTNERDANKPMADDYTGIIGRDDLLNRRAGLDKAIADAKGAVAEDRATIEEEGRAIIAILERTKEKADRFTRRESGEKRVKDLKAEEKKLAGEFEELEKMLYLIETFIKQKVALLTDRINSKFAVVSFKLFNQLVNGGIEECCVFTVNGIPYDGGLNAAARTQGGLDIIRTLQEHYGIAPTIFIDNRESCTEIPALDCQVVNLIVSPTDKALRIEVAR